MYTGSKVFERVRSDSCDVSESLEEAGQASVFELVFHLSNAYTLLIRLLKELTHSFVAAGFDEVGLHGTIRPKEVFALGMDDVEAGEPFAELGFPRLIGYHVALQGREFGHWEALDAHVED